MPYTPPEGAFGQSGTYLTPKDTADPIWVKITGLEPKFLPKGKWKSLSRAEVLEIQARSEFDRFDPMEVIATTKETADLLAKYPARAYLLFPEDRKYPVRMEDDLPLRWIQNGPGMEFSGQAQPGEFYVFQVGVYAARCEITNLTLKYSDLQLEKGDVIPVSAFRCFNLGGTDWLGRPMKKTFEVGQGKVRPLWIGVQVPPQASGDYRGTILVQPEGAPESAVNLRLSVSGPVLADAGDSELWRLSRLRWLDSTLGIDDDVIPPYTPLEVQGQTVSCLGRTVRFGKRGLPESIRSNGREILARPVNLTVETSKGPAAWKTGKSQTLKAKPGVLVQESTAGFGPFSLTTRSNMEFDGSINFCVTLKSKVPVEIKDIGLEIPIKKEVAVYMMGFGKEGGYRSQAWLWAWDIERADNMVWLGDAGAGLQLNLLGPADIWEDNFKKLGVPESWDNNGLGGAAITEKDDTVLVHVFTGERILKPDKALQFRFRLLVTPLKPVDVKNHWNWRRGYGHVKGGANILHIHSGFLDNPFINYPFLTIDRLIARIKAVNAPPEPIEVGRLTYPAEGNINLDQGALHLWSKVNFDPRVEVPADEAADLLARYNQPLFSLIFPNNDIVVFYWNIDYRGMIAFIRKGAPELNQYPVWMPTRSPQWQKGERHLLTLSWGDKFGIFIDGKKLALMPYQGTLKKDLKDAVLQLEGGFGIDAVKITDIPFEEGMPITPSVDSHTLLLDTFSNWDGKKKTRPEKIAGQGYGKVEGTCYASSGEQGKEIVFSSKKEPASPKGVNLYYTVRELSNHVVEMWPLRSLGDEIFKTDEAWIYWDKGAAMNKPGGGYPWLMEHLVSGYVPGWRSPLAGGLIDAAIATQGLSRWHNYYLEGLRWLMEKTGIDGLYLDGIGYDREIMKRVAKVMYRTNPASRINFHHSNIYPSRKIRPDNVFIEHSP